MVKNVTKSVTKKASNKWSDCTFIDRLFVRTPLAMAICLVFTQQTLAQETLSGTDTPAVPAGEEAPLSGESNDLEEVVVYGVRASQAKAIDIKRNSAAIVDSIVAEDIGKLPDTTITDS